MTRKDYVLIAQAIKREIDMGPGVSGEREKEIASIAQLNVAKSIANVLAWDNPRFDRERFMRACGFDD